MPIYEYQCEKCGHQLEAIQKISDAPLVDCPACQKAGLQKLVSAASFRLKGSGWYETDFKTGDKKQLADSGSEATKASSGSSKQDAAANAPKTSAGADSDKKASTAGSESKKSSKQAAKSGSK